FFFQAEDGIRDKLVTGVQTCALPISYFAVGMLVVLRVFDHLLQRGLRAAFRVNRTVEKPSIGFRLRGLLSGFTRLTILFGIGLRSEERRVGKECRGRLSG